MNRAGLCVVMATVFAIGCGGGDNGATPTSPSGVTGSAPPSAGSPSCVPATPANLAVASIVGTTVTLAWSPVSGATQYEVIVGTAPSSSNTLLTNTSNANYTWGGVRPGTYYARVQAANTCGSSTPSTEVVFTVG